MTTPPPLPPLKYARRYEPPREPLGGWLGFLLGAGGGFAFSLVYYFVLAVNSDSQTSGWAMMGAVIIKFLVGLGLLFSHRWRRPGLGLICSVPIAILLVIGLCFGMLGTFR